MSMGFGLFLGFTGVVRYWGVFRVFEESYYSVVVWFKGFFFWCRFDFNLIIDFEVEDRRLRFVFLFLLSVLRFLNILLSFRGYVVFFVFVGRIKVKE